MVLFGFICLVILAVYITVATLGGMYAYLGFTGKIPPIFILFAIFSACLWYLVYNNVPFTITMK